VQALVHVLVLARLVGRDNTGVHAGVKAGAHAQGPCFCWSKGAVHGRDGRDSRRRTLEHDFILVYAIRMYISTYQVLDFFCTD
jgi:hypothetical protein